MGSLPMMSLASHSPTLLTIQGPPRHVLTCSPDHTVTRRNDMSYFAYACKTGGQNGISHLISALCVNCLSSIPEYSRLNYLDEYLV